MYRKLTPDNAPQPATGGAPFHTSNLSQFGGGRGPDESTAASSTASVGDVRLASLTGQRPRRPAAAVDPGLGSSRRDRTLPPPNWVRSRLPSLAARRPQPKSGTNASSE
jgi:hypothetical protein